MHIILYTLLTVGFNLSMIQVNITWDANSADAPMHDFFVGFSSTNISNGDIMPFTATHGHQHILTYHANLVSNLIFYISIRAVNKAGTEATKVRFTF